MGINSRHQVIKRLQAELPRGAPFDLATLALLGVSPQLAARYADHLFALRAGRLVASGAPRDVVTSALVREVFDLDALVIDDPVSGTPLVLPRGRHRVRQAGTDAAPAADSAAAASPAPVPVPSTTGESR